MLRCAILLALITLCTCHGRIRLQEVTSLTLNRGDYTTARRSAPVPQLKCIGGSAKGKYEPKVVQCYNRGFDGSDVQWECTSEMRNEFEFGKIRVTCEGFDYPEDPFVLAGSCGLEYELEYTDEGRSHGSTLPDKDSYRSSSLGTWLTVGIICFIVYLVYTGWTSPREGHEGDRNRGGFGGGPPPYPPPGPGPDGRSPPPPGFKTNFDAPPPTYDEACHRSGTTGASGGGPQPANSGPGFFTGLGLGGLAGYAFGRSGNRDSSYHHQQGPSQWERNTGFFSDTPSTSGAFRRPSSSRSSTETRTTSGFGGTVRR